jgi:1-acyl-sn-glycerol-3-phosphate acyltransferase
MRRGPAPALHRDPDAFLYTLVAAIVGLMLRLVFRLHVRRDAAVRRLRGPVIVVGNHPSYLDPFIMGLALLPRRINFLTTDYFFRVPWMRSLLLKVGAIPKVQFRSDVHAMKQMIATYRAGGIIGIFPEGQRSVDGRMMPFEESMAKMVQKFDCPVVAVVEHGAYLAWPRWSLSGPRPGRIDVTASVLFQAGEAGRMTLQHVREKISAALDYHDYDWIRQKKHGYLSAAPARGLHLILHRCPACGRSQTITSSRFCLICTSCGNRGKVDRHGLIHPLQRRLSGKYQFSQHDRRDGDIDQPEPRVWPDAAKWHRWQVDEQIREMDAPGFSLSFRARLERPAAFGHPEIVGSGQMTVTGQAITFQEDSAPDGQARPPVEIPFGNRAGVNADYGLNCELVHNDAVYRFVFSDSQAVIRLVDAIQAAQERKQDMDRNMAAANLTTD